MEPNGPKGVFCIRPVDKTRKGRPPLEERIRLLSLVDIFEPLSEEEIEQLNGQLSDVHLEPNEIFYTPHDRSEKLFVLWKGRVRIYRTTDGGREFTLATVEAGTVFGEMALTAQQMQEAYALGHGAFGALRIPK